jgi:hypothetical protein
VYEATESPKETRRYWKLKEGILYRAVWRSRFGIRYGLVVRQEQDEDAIEMLLTFVLLSETVLRHKQFESKTPKLIIFTIKLKLLCLLQQHCLIR